MVRRPIHKWGYVAAEIEIRQQILVVTIYPSFIVNDHHGQLLVLDDDITLSANEDVRTVYDVKLSESTNSEDIIWKVQDGKLLS